MGRNAKDACVLCSLKASTARLTVNFNRMPDERLPKDFSMGNYRRVARHYTDTLKASLKDFDIPIGSWEQTVQELSKR